MDLIGKPDPYCILSICQEHTKCKHITSYDPKWNATYSFDIKKLEKRLTKPNEMTLEILLMDPNKIYSIYKFIDYYLFSPKNQCICI